jgi:hypothetical protein
VNTITSRGHRRLLLSPDRFRDIWKIWPAWKNWQRVRWTFERPPDGPYRVIMIEEGNTNIDESGQSALQPA